MSQTSQIFIRYNGSVIVANHYTWNFAEGMISRARYLIEDLRDTVSNNHGYFLEQKDYIERQRRYCDVNFDMRDLVMSKNIIEEYITRVKEKSNQSPSDFLYSYHCCSDLQLYIDVDDEPVDLPFFSIKYCFYDPDKDKTYTTKEYIRRYDDADVDDEDKTICEKNIAYITEHSVYMTHEDLEAFWESPIHENAMKGYM